MTARAGAGLKGPMWIAGDGFPDWRRNRSRVSARGSRPRSGNRRRRIGLCQSHTIRDSQYGKCWISFLKSFSFVLFAICYACSDSGGHSQNTVWVTTNPEQFGLAVLTTIGNACFFKIISHGGNYQMLVCLAHRFSILAVRLESNV